MILSNSKDLKNQKKIGPIHQVIRNIFMGFLSFWLVTFFYIFLLFGALQEKYKYSSTLIEDILKNLEIATKSLFGTLIRMGASRPNFYILVFILVVVISGYYLIYLEIKEGYKIYKELKGGSK